MKISKAIKKLNRNGYGVKKVDAHRSWRGVQLGNAYVIELLVDREGDLATIRVRHMRDSDERITDYSGGSFYPNLTQAITASERTRISAR